jgi:integrase/recombinase XerD
VAGWFPVARINEEILMENYLKHCHRQDKTEKTIENYLSTLQVFRNYLKKEHVDLLSAASRKMVLEGFHDYLKDDRQVSYARIKVYYSALSHFYTWCEYKGFIRKNMVLAVRKMYVQSFKNGYMPAERKIISVEEMSRFLKAIPNIRDKAMITLFVKTGVRRGELIAMDVDDVKMDRLQIDLKPNKFHKRSSLVVFFDKETKQLLEQWIWKRDILANKGEKALFVGEYGRRMNKNNVYDAVVRWTKRLGLYDTKTDRIEDHFSVHNLRHCFSTYMQRAGMPRDFIKELRGDKRNEIIDIYTHIDRDELRRSYLSTVPQFGVV